MGIWFDITSILLALDPCVRGTIEDAEKMRFGPTAQAHHRGQVDTLMSRSSSFIRLAIPSLSRLVVPFLLLVLHLAATANAMEECDAPLKVLVTGTLMPTPNLNQTWTIPPANLTAISMSE